MEQVALNLTGLKVNRKRRMSAVCDGLAIIDDRGRVAYINDPFLKRLGVLKTEILRKPLTDYLDESCRDSFRQSFLDKTPEFASTLDLAIATGNGHKISAKLSVLPGSYNDRLIGLLTEEVEK